MTDPTDPRNHERGALPTSSPAAPVPSLEQEAAAADPPSDWNAEANAHDLSVGHAAPKDTLIALGRLVFPPEAVLDDEAVAARDQRWASRSIVVAAALMLVFNAVSIQNWSREQAPGWVTSTVQQLGDVWATQLTQLGANRPRQAVRDAWARLQSLTFDGRDPQKD